MIIPSFFFILISLLSARFLSGDSYCDGSKSTCFTSMLGTTLFKNVTIPNIFCNNDLECECLSDSDCGSNACVCINSTCIPTIGNRATAKTKNYNYDFFAIILSQNLFLIVYNHHHLVCQQSNLF